LFYVRAISAYPNQHTISIPGRAARVIDNLTDGMRSLRVAPTLRCDATGRKEKACEKICQSQTGHFIGSDNREPDIGLDLGDKWAQLCALDCKGDVIETGRVKMSRDALSNRFGGIESDPHCY
jgi:hypothetical protein